MSAAVFVMANNIHGTFNLVLKNEVIFISLVISSIALHVSILSYWQKLPPGWPKSLYVCSALYYGSCFNKYNH